MAADYWVRIKIDEDELTADKTAEVLRRLIQVLESETLDIDFTGTYTAGTEGDVVISVGTQTITDIGFLVAVDSTVSADKKAELTRKIIQVLESESLVIAYYESNAASQSNQITINVS